MFSVPGARDRVGEDETEVENDKGPTSVHVSATRRSSEFLLEVPMENGELAICWSNSHHAARCYLAEPGGFARNTRHTESRAGNAPPVAGEANFLQAQVTSVAGSERYERFLTALLDFLSKVYDQVSSVNRPSLVNATVRARRVGGIGEPHGVGPLQFPVSLTIGQAHFPCMEKVQAYLCIPSL